MSHDDPVSAAMKRANPVPPDDLGGESGRSPDEMLAHVKTPAKPRSHAGSTDSTPVLQRRGPLVAVGGFVLVIVLGVGGALLFRSGSGTLTTPTTETPALTTPINELPRAPDPIETVRSMFDAWNRGDIEGYLAVQSEAFVVSTARIILEGAEGDPEPDSQQAEALIRYDFTYWFLIGTEWELRDCSAQPTPSGRGDQVSCQLIANSAFERAYRVPNNPKPVRFNVVQGLIVAGTADRIGRGVYPTAAAAFLSWVKESIEGGSLQASEVPCSTTSIYRARQGRVPTVECSQWIVDQLPDWIATLEPTG